MNEYAGTNGITATGLEAVNQPGEIFAMCSAILLVLGIASFVSYINGLDILVAVFQILLLLVFKKVCIAKSRWDSVGHQKAIYADFPKSQATQTLRRNAQ